jgi:hypothetical protein
MIPIYTPVSKDYLANVETPKTKGTLKERICIALPLKQEIQFGTECCSLDNINSILHFF